MQRTIEDGSQGQWDFDPPVTKGSKDRLPRYYSTAPAVVFVDPDPRRLFVGQTRLEAFLAERGQTAPFLLRELLAALDWSPFEAAYKPGGRSPYHPRAMVGLVLFGIMDGKSSLRELEVVASCDVRCWWITGGLCPDHSAIGKFLVLHREVLTEHFFEDLTRQVLRRTGSDCSRVAGDGTVIEAMSSRMRRLSKEAAEQRAAEAAARAQAAPEDSGAQREAERAQKEAEAVERRIEAAARRDHKQTDAVTCPTDPDAAVNQTKRNKAYKPSYVPSVLANEDRIITAQTVDPTSETEVVESLVGQSERVSGQKVEELLLDGGYFCAAMAVLCMTQDINLLCPSGRVEKNALSSKKSDKYSKDAFCYEEDRDEYVCPAGQALKFETASEPGEHRQGYRRYRCTACGGCSYRERCTTDPKGRSIKRYPEDALLEAEKAVMKHPGARAQYRHRKAWVEPVFGEQRGIQGLSRFHRRGLEGVKLEYALHSAAHNTRRYLALGAAQRRADAEAAGRERAAPAAVAAAESIAPPLLLRSIRGGLALGALRSSLVRLEPANTGGYGLQQAA